ncbi:hypothetical protein GOC61_25450 [Sinorhizobium medicae]|nr:hypothetical protein [Sinorhizobium medicae]MDX1059377.1 hypothetical protein [Sinorhizobium medicae]
MTGAEIMYAVGFFVGLFGAVFGVWKFFDSKIGAVRDDLASHKLHIAEHYVSKQGLRETTEQIMAAIGGVKDAVDNMTLRVDRIVENQAKPRTTRA